jgi:hypothetical protein
MGPDGRVALERYQRTAGPTPGSDKSSLSSGERIAGMLQGAGFTELERALSSDGTGRLFSIVREAIKVSETAEAFVQALANVEAPLLGERILLSLHLGEGADSIQLAKAGTSLEQIKALKSPYQEWSRLLEGFGETVEFQPSDQRKLAKMVLSAITTHPDNFEELREGVIKGAHRLLNSDFVSFKREMGATEAFCSLKASVDGSISDPLNDHVFSRDAGPKPPVEKTEPLKPPPSTGSECPQRITTSSTSVFTTPAQKPKERRDPPVLELIQLLEDDPEAMRAFVINNDLSFVHESPGLLTFCGSRGKPKTVAVLLEALLVSRPRPSSSLPIIESANPEALKLMGDEGIHELRERFGFCSCGHSGFGHAQILNAVRSLEAMFLKQLSGRETLMSSAFDPKDPREAAEYLVTRMLQVPESLFRQNRNIHYKTLEQIDARKFGDEELSKLVSDVKKRLDSITGDFFVNSSELLEWVPQVKEVLALPSHFQEVIIGGFLEGKDTILRKLSNLYESEMVGQRTEAYAESLLKILQNRSFISDYEATAQFSRADKSGVDFRMYLEDGRTVDIDVKSSPFGRDETLNERRLFTQEKSLPWGVTIGETLDGSRYLYRPSEVVVIDSQKSDEENIQSILEAIKAGTSFPEELRAIKTN